MTSPDPSTGFDFAVYAVIAKQLSVRIESLRPDTRLVDDLEADLVALTELALALEDMLEIEIIDTEWIEIEYVGEVVDYVRTRIDRGVGSKAR